MPPQHFSRLPRLAAEAYRGFSSIHWSMTIEGRRTGWLDAAHHASLREILLHTCHRYHLICPAYCLMPDHGHFLWQGLRADADQQRASTWFRRTWNELLAPACSLQRQAYDHVLRPAERERNAYATITTYVLQNPERAGLVSQWNEWPYAGAVFPGVYPLDPRAADYHDRLWRTYNRAVGEREGARNDSVVPLHHP